jgi:hypothetical protein
MQLLQNEKYRECIENARAKPARWRIRVGLDAMGSASIGDDFYSAAQRLAPRTKMAPCVVSGAGIRLSSENSSAMDEWCVSPARGFWCIRKSRPRLLTSRHSMRFRGLAEKPPFLPDGSLAGPPWRAITAYRKVRTLYLIVAKRALKLITARTF